MAVVQLTSLPQFNTVVSSPPWCFRAACLCLISHAAQINADRVAVVYFWAYWCGPCRGMTPIFNGVADSGSLAGVDFYRVDIDHANDIVQHIGGQTVRFFVFNAHALGVRRARVIFSNASMCRFLDFTCTSAAGN